MLAAHETEEFVVERNGRVKKTAEGNWKRVLELTLGQKWSSYLCVT
jgi:hypothetical protein